MSDDEQTQRLWARMREASSKLGQVAGVAGNKAEQEYAEAYRRLVVAGLARKLRRKYTGR